MKSSIALIGFMGTGKTAVGKALAGRLGKEFVETDALIEKLGGDSLSEMRPRFDALRRGRLGDLPMDGESWRFGYE